MEQEVRNVCVEIHFKSKIWLSKVSKPCVQAKVNISVQLKKMGEKILESLYVSVVARHSLKTNRMHKKYVSKENLVAFFHIFVIMKYELYALKYVWKPLQISFCTSICELYYDLLWFCAYSRAWISLEVFF